MRPLVDLLRVPRYEVIPTPAIAQAILEATEPGEVTITVTASPVKGLEPTLALTERLAGHGYRVVPHLPARLVVDEVHLKDVVARLKDIGVDDVFVPAGDADPPAGTYHGALDLLVDLTEMGRPFGQVGITGYPQTHPVIQDDIVVQSMWDKRRHASYLVSNLCFDPVTLTRWIHRVRARGVELPLQVGLAGPVDRTRLVTMAAKIGIGESTRFLGKHYGWFLRFAAPGGYAPERLLGRLGPTLVAPASRVAGLHVFTFNQVAATQRWRTEVLNRLTGPPAR
ncbi:methylenetetrahydrofolate reductase [Pseudonocardia hispaniensis]|uniref:Methylenetetrahydrofolate reductase n=1 Tax=Pseudonocardia hispaniensis TaxID=904933 RepID=A0ABW1IZD2_9PSEU